MSASITDTTDIVSARMSDGGRARRQFLSVPQAARRAGVSERSIKIACEHQPGLGFRLYGRARWQINPDVLDRLIGAVPPAAE